MRLVNTAGYPYVTNEFGGLNVPPDGEVDIEDGYCRPGVMPNRMRRPSIVEMLAPFLLPADPEARARWGKEDVAPAPPEPTVEQKAAGLVAEGMAPAVAELVAAGNVEQPKRGPGRPRKAVT